MVSWRNSSELQQGGAGGGHWNWPILPHQVLQSRNRLQVVSGPDKKGEVSRMPGQFNPRHGQT